MLVTWSLNIDDVIGISIYRDGELTAEVAPDVSSYPDAGLYANTRYEYRIEIGREDRPVAIDRAVVATLVHPPLLDFQMRTHLNGFQVPIVDELNPEHTEYKVTVSGGSSSPVISDWSSSKCRTFDELRSNTGYDVSVVARNLDGIQAYASKLARGDELPVMVYSTGSRPASVDPWVTARASDIGRIYGLTEAAVEWINDDLHIERKRAEPGKFAYYRGGYIEVGHTNPWSIMHEVMHAFWSHWNGFAEPCDLTNVYTFWVDTAQFLLDFREHDGAGTSNPFEPWRHYYDWMVWLLEIYTQDGEDHWQILERRDFHMLPDFYHIVETSLPAHASGNMALIPPPLQKYMRGFIEEGESTTWAEEEEWYSRLTAEDQRLWQVMTGRVNAFTPLALDIRWPVQDAMIDESTREILKAAERQRLRDFINTMEDVAQSEFWAVDPRFWNRYIRDHVRLVPLHLNELDSSPGMELDDAAFDAVAEGLRLISRLHVGGEDWSHVHGSIFTLEDITEPQRTALLRMIGSATGSNASTTFGRRLDSNRWLLYGSAEHVPSAEIIQLTPARHNQLGMLFHRHLTDLEGVRIEFSFEIGGGSGADGLALLLVRTMPDFNQFEQRFHYGGGWGSRYLNGYAVVFDTFLNEMGIYEVGGQRFLFPISDPSGNFVALAELGAGSDVFDINYLEAKKLDQDLNNAGVFDAEVELNDYGRLKVYLSNKQAGMAKTLVIDHKIENYAPFEGYIGFIGSTGGLTDRHFIYSVRFDGE